MQRKYHTNLPFLDLLFNILIGFVFLFIVSFLLINPIAKRADIEVKAEFLITVFWPDNLEDDVDIYVEDPIGNLVWFKSREPGLMHLDRDDLGKKNDEIVTAAGTILFPENREIVTLRGVIPGEYIINIHMYFKVGQEQIGRAHV